MQTLDEARKRAAAEQGSRKASLAQDRRNAVFFPRTFSPRDD